MTTTSQATAYDRPSEAGDPARTPNRLRPAVLAGVRIVVAFLFVLHGTQGLFGTFGGTDMHGGTVPFLAWPAWWASILELIAGSLVMLGLFTRPAALLCSGAMAYAYFTVHQPLGLFPLENMGEQAVLYCWTFLLIAVFGAGSYALDNLRGSVTAWSRSPH